MCDPVTIGLIATTVLSAGAAVHQGQVQSNYADYQADQARADANAETEAAQVEAGRIRDQAKAQRSQAIAALAGSGVNVDSGTALKIDQTIDKNANKDAYLTIAGANDQALRLNAEATGYNLQGDQAKDASYVNATTSLLAGATNNGKGWKKAKGVA